MKVKIHPKYYKNIKITCRCGAVFLAGSTKESISTETCSACHPFYTGNQKAATVGGQVEKFLAKVKKAQSVKEKKVKPATETEEE
jgi:large subunit ribosomal protein L31